MIHLKPLAAGDLLDPSGPRRTAWREAKRMLSIPHLLVIFLVAFIVLGPEKLPEVARVLGRTMAQFRRITGDFRTQIETEMRDLENQARLREAQEYQRKIAAAEPPPPEPAQEASQPKETAAPEGAPVTVGSSAPEPSEKPHDGEPHPA